MKQKVPMRYLVPVLTAAAALSLSGVALAANPPDTGQSSSYQGRQTGSDQSSQSSQPSSEMKRLSGTIRSIDTSAGTVTVKGLFLSKTFHADASALQGLNVGDKVDVSYSQQGDNMVASSITRSAATSGSSEQPASESPSRNPSSSPSTAPSGSSQQPQP